MPNPYAERLAVVVRREGPLCVGLDPRWDALPVEFQVGVGPAARAAAYGAFCRAILPLVRPFSGIVKPQAAFFEQQGPAGLAELQQVIQAARQLEFFVILDAKRGDIASTATAYAEAAFEPDIWHADALTVNPYLGADAVEPFITEAEKHQGGLFVLVRTSNPGSGLFQNLVCEGVPLYQSVADQVRQWNDATRRGGRFGSVGAVVGATHPEELAKLRAQLDGVWFLVPGYGAQGGRAADVASAFTSDGQGAIINSSRGILFPYRPTASDWRAAVESAARSAQAELRAVAGL